jgi:hypothetical protein
MSRAFVFSTPVVHAQRSLWSFDVSPSEALHDLYHIMIEVLNVNKVRSRCFISSYRGHFRLHAHEGGCRNDYDSARFGTASI